MIIFYCITLAIVFEFLIKSKHKFPNQDDLYSFEFFLMVFETVGFSYNSSPYREVYFDDYKNEKYR